MRYIAHKRIQNNLSKETGRQGYLEDSGIDGRRAINEL
jgi:hypothetical protein